MHSYTLRRSDMNTFKLGLPEARIKAVRLKQRAMMLMLMPEYLQASADVGMWITFNRQHELTREGIVKTFVKYGVNFLPVMMNNTIMATGLKTEAASIWN